MIDTSIEEPMLETIEEEEQNEYDLGKKLKALTVTKETVERLTERAGGHYDESTSACKCGIKSRPEELITFNGDPLIFKEFWTKFKSCIGSNEELSNIEKLSCLRGLLKGQALKSISDLKLTNSNYLEAVEILKIRYENKETLVKRYLEAIATLPIVKDISNMTSLQQCVDTLEISVNILCQLGKETDSYGSLLITLILDSVPDELRISIGKRFDTNTNDVFTFIDVFKEEVGALEKCNLTQDCNLDTSLLHSNEKSLVGFNDNDIYSQIYSSKDLTTNSELNGYENMTALNGTQKALNIASQKSTYANGLAKVPTLQNLTIENHKSNYRNSIENELKHESSLESPSSNITSSQKHQPFTLKTHKNDNANEVENNDLQQTLDSKTSKDVNEIKKSETNYHFGKITNSFNDQLTKLLNKDVTVSPLFSKEDDFYSSSNGDAINGVDGKKSTLIINEPKLKNSASSFDTRKESRKCFLCSTKGQISQECFPHVACASRITENECNYCENDKNVYNKTNKKNEKNGKNDGIKFGAKNLHDVRRFEEEHSDLSEGDEKLIKRQRRMCEYKKGVTIRKVKESNSEFRMYDDAFYQHKLKGFDNKYKTIKPKKRYKEKANTCKDNTLNKKTIEPKRDLEKFENFLNENRESDESDKRNKNRDKTKYKDELNLKSEYKKSVLFDYLIDKDKGRGVRFTDQKYLLKNGDLVTNRYEINKGSSYDNLYEDKPRNFSIKRNASFNIQRNRYNHSNRDSSNRDLRYCKSEVNLYKPENDLYHDKEKRKNKIIRSKMVDDKHKALQASEPVDTDLKLRSKEIKRNLDNCEYFDCKYQDQTKDTERNSSPYEEENMQLSHLPDSDTNMSIFDVIYQNHLKRIAKNLSAAKSGEDENEEENQEYGDESDDSVESTTSSYGHYTDCSLQTDVISQCTLKRTPNPYNYKAKFIPRLPFVACKHRSYITEAMRNILKLKTLRQERIEIKSFASEQEFIETLDVVTICVQGKSGRNAYIDALVVPFICSSFENPRLKSIKDNFAYLKCLGEPETRKVNDDMFYIDILVGIEYYYSLVTGKTIKTPHDQPVAIERSLVWIVCGPNVQILL